MKRIGKRKICKLSLAILSFISVCVSPMTVRATAQIDHSQNCSLTLTYHYEEHSIEGATFRLYRVASIDAAGQYSLTSEFADSQVDLDTEDEATLSACASTLESYILQAQSAQKTIEPKASGQTDAQGKLAFNNLQTGLYLVTGDALRIRDRIYIPMATLITLPELEEGGEWDYDLESHIKHEGRIVDEGDDLISLNVVKIWKDTGYESERPSEVTVELFGDGVSYDRVTLNKWNNWQYQWDELDNNVFWQLTEVDVPETYTVTVEQDNGNFIVTNTYQKKEDPKDDPKTPDQPDETPKTDKPATAKIPKTGQLWWPVPVLLLGGAAMVAASLTIKRRKK